MSVAETGPVAVVVGADPDDTVGRLVVATDLRAAGIAARAELGHRKLGKQLEAAAQEQAHFAVILGDELAKGEVGLRDLPAGTQKLIAIGDLAREIERAHGAHRHGTHPTDRRRCAPSAALRRSPSRAFGDQRDRADRRDAGEQEPERKESLACRGHRSGGGSGTLARAVARDGRGDRGR